MKRSVKILKMLLVVVMAFMLTGCVKLNATMEITKNGKINYNVLYAIDKSLLNGQKVFTDEDKKKVGEQGYKVEDYSDGNMEGVNIYIKDLDINTVSTDKDTLYDLSGITNGKDSKKMFSVKKGFLKNTYTAKIKFEADASNLGDLDNNDDDSEDTSYEKLTDDDTTLDGEITLGDGVELDGEISIGNGSDTDTETDTDTDFTIGNGGSTGDFDFSQYMTNLDMKFTVKLPYKAISNNATTVSNDGKELNWDLTKANEIKNLEFQFVLYNTTNIIILVAGAVVVILVVVFLLLNKKNKGKKENSLVNNQPVVNPVNDVNNGINTFPVDTNTAVAATSSVGEATSVNNTVSAVDTTNVSNVTPVAEPVAPVAETVTPVVEPITPVAEPITPVAETVTPVVAAENTKGNEDSLVI